jgi:hypothetical protein
MPIAAASALSASMTDWPVRWSIAAWKRATSSLSSRA